MMFKPSAGQVNYSEMEHSILHFWQEGNIFEKLRVKNAAGSQWSFIDGPITANNLMGVHHGWGRTYKDISCRYKAMRGYKQRWQNGFDCQGLWLEVEVEKQLGFNSKQDIVNYGLDRFSRACRTRVEEFAERITQQSIRLGQWMRWSDEQGKPASYFTMDDNNIEHIWYFLNKCEEKGWLYVGHRVMPWCWRCGTSLSQHELIDSYQEQVDPSVYFRCAIHGRERKYFLVWTTTPWTLTANTALAIHPEMDYVKARLNGDIYYLIVAGADAVLPKDAEKLGTVKGRELLDLTYDGPFSDLPAQAHVNRRTIPWEAISTEEGTGIVHIAPGCGAEDFELGKELTLDTLVPIDDSGYFVDGFGWLEGKHVTESAALIREDLQRERALNPEAVDELLELHRPWIDGISIRCPQCGTAVERVPEVGDCWLDAGIVPYSTLNYLPDHLGITGAVRSIRSEETTENGQSAWQRWFPAHFITEMREQVRLWFYSMLFMSVVLEDRTPYLSVLTYEEMRDEKGKAMSKTLGNAPAFDEAAEKMGADPMRWLYAAAPLNQIFRFGYGPADEVKRKMLTLWNCYKFFIEYANLDKPSLRLAPASDGDAPLANELDHWILARLQQLIALCNDRLDHFDSATVTRAVEEFIDELSTCYVRQSRRRFWKGKDDAHKAAAYQTLYDVLVTLAQLIAPILPFTAEEIYQNLVRSVHDSAPESVHLCAYPQVHPAWEDAQLVEDIATLRRVVSLALSARQEANVKVRQPLPRLLVKPSDARQHEVLMRLQDQVLNELNVKQLAFIEDESTLHSVAIKPNLAKLGPKFGRRLPHIQQALASANAAEIGAKVVSGEAVELRVNDESITLTPDELIVERLPAAGLAVASDSGCIVALETRLTQELVHEGMARDLVRYVQDLRKKANFNIADRIVIHYVAEGEAAEAIARHADYIQGETLADALTAGEPPDGSITTTLTLGGQPVRIGVMRV